MKTKDHYDHHLAKFYAWMMGDFEDRKNEFRQFCISHNLVPTEKNKQAIDLGAGNGIQTVALAELGFNVTAIDFNAELLRELQERINDQNIKIIEDDIRSLNRIGSSKAALIICCGDTITHLDNFIEVENLIKDSFVNLDDGGRLVLSFRDYTNALEDDHRFIPVKSEDNRILTCFLEYFPGKVRVTDLLHEKRDDAWTQKVSSYYKVRLTKPMVLEFMEKAGFAVTVDTTMSRMITLIGEK